MSLNWNFPGGGGFKQNKKTLRGGSMGIFWNNTISNLHLIQATFVAKKLMKSD